MLFSPWVYGSAHSVRINSIFHSLLHEPVVRTPYNVPSAWLSRHPIYSFKSHPRLSAASESKNIKKRRIYSHNAALNRSTIRLSGITKETSTVQLNLSHPGKFIFLYCNVIQFEVSIFIALLLLLTFAYRITSFTNIMIQKNIISAAALKRV